MFKILHLLVVSFIILVTFSFSHFLYLLNFEIVADFFGRGGYEGIKAGIISVYGILFGIWLILYFLRYQVYKGDKKIIKWVGIIFLLILTSSLLSINVIGSFIGLSEKYHSFLFFTSLLLFFTSIYFGYEKEEYKKIFNYIFIFSIPVYIYALAQWAGYDPLVILYESRVPVTRASSFFGNANYLAGYILLLLPLSNFIYNNFYRFSFVVFSLVVLFFTGSYFGIFLGIIYLLHFLYSFNKKIFSIFFISMIVFAAFLINTLTVEKFGSMMARPYIWKSSISAVFDTPKTILIGYGPDTLQEVFNDFKAPELSEYETSYYTADRSHNIFIDLIFFFGIIGGGLISFFLLKTIFISQNKDVRLSILLFLIFFSFNIPISIHYILFLLLLSGVYSKNL